MIRRTLAAAAAGLLVLALSPPAQAAAADKGSGKPPRLVGSERLSAADQARQRAQEPLLDLNNRVHDLTANSYDTHFAGAQLDARNKTLVIYWAGQVPRALDALRTEAAKRGTTLAIRPARFSRAQLMAAADRVMPTAELDGTVALAVDGSGLTVAAGNLPAVARGVRPATAAETRLMRRISDTRSRGIPVTVTAARPGVPQFDDTRRRDGSPYWAGAQINMLGRSCTSGFSMYASASPSTRFTLTAAHCPRYTDDIAITNGGGDHMGHSDFIHELYDNNTAAYDLGVVRLHPGQSNAPFIYVGEDHTEGGIAVSGYASAGIPADGNYCVHGMLAISCDLLSGGTIRQCTGRPPEGRCVFTVEMRVTHAGAIIWCRGDSGGPIYYWTGNTVVAAGVVSWSNHEVEPCSFTGGASVVATAVNRIPGLRVVTTSAP